MNIFDRRPLVCMAFSYIGALFFCVISSISYGAVPSVVLLSIGTAALINTLFSQLARKRFLPTKRRATLAACIVCIMCASLVALFSFVLPEAEYKKYEGKTVCMDAVVTKVYVEQSEYASFIAKVKKIDGVYVDFKVSIFAEFSPQVSEDDTFTCICKLNDIRDEGSYFDEIYIKRNKLYFGTVLDDKSNFEHTGETVTLARRIERLGEKTGYAMERILTKSSASLANALILGDRDDLPDILRRDFTRIGISHMLALSGMHLSLIIGSIMLLLRFFLPDQNARFVACALLSVFLIMFTGMSASALRAGIMLVYYQAGLLFKNRSDMLTALFATVWIIVLFHPHAILDTALILSFCATFGIAVMMPAFNDFSYKLFGNSGKRSIVRVCLRYAFNSICMSFSAGVFSSIAAIFLFGEISLLSIFSTLVFSPLIAAFMLSSALALIFSRFGVVSKMFVLLSSELCRLIYSLASHLSSIDGAVISASHPTIRAIGIITSVILVYAVIKNITPLRFAVVTAVTRVALLFITEAVLILGPCDVNMSVIANAENTGMFISDGNVSAYIDASYGTSGFCTNIIDAVRERRDTDLDVLMLTHYHFAYFRAVRQINDEIPIKLLLMPMPSNEKDAKYAVMIENEAKKYGIEYRYYEEADTVDVGVAEISFLGYERTKTNEHPRIAFSVNVEDKNIVYTGGYNEKCERYERYETFLRQADVVVLGSHGPSAEFPMDKIPPTCYVLSFHDTVSERTALMHEVFCEYGSFDILK